MSFVTDNNIDGRKRIRRNDGIKLMIDPSLYKNNLQKFSDNTIDVKPKPLDHLTYFYNNFINLSDDEKKTIKMTIVQAKWYDFKKNNLLGISVRAEWEYPSTDKLPQSIIDSLKKLKNKSRVIAEVSDNFNLFDSDEEYYNNEKPTLDIAINTIFEDESGKECLNLQKKFRSDDR
ncbi:hypothetical protein C2G38_2053168, partial [Gigaspora rosea]